MLKTVSKKTYFPLHFLFVISPFLIGMYYEWTSCIAAVFLSAYLIYCRKISGQIIFPKSPMMYACLTVVCAFILSPLWAVDKGMTVFGAVKFLPLPLFCMALAQVNSDERQKLINAVPIIGAIMTVISFPLSFVPILKDYLLVGGRLAGFFQYSNTYAIYLLVGIVIAVGSDWIAKKKLVISAVLLVGIFLSGSRTVFILLAAAAVIYLIKSKNKNLKIALSGVFGAILLVAIIYALITKSFDTVGRFLTSSLLSSTFLGRLLYYKDALPVILHHPFGLGYMGYYFLQGSFQTGVYSVVNIHNEFLQILLDIGWVPFAVCVWALIKSFLGRDAVTKSAIAVIIIHCLLDFDLQFVSVCFVLILLSFGSDVPAVKIKKNVVIYSAGIVILTVSIYFGSAEMLMYLKNYDMATQIYPAYTSAYIQKISEADTVDEASAIADKIICLNDSVSIAYSAKSRKAFADGDIQLMTEYKKKAISLAVYSIEEYREYREMLEIAEDLYLNAGDELSAEYCQRCNSDIEVMLEKVKNNTSKLAYMIDDKPELEM